MTVNAKRLMDYEAKMGVLGLTLCRPLPLIMLTTLTTPDQGAAVDDFLS